MKINQLFEGVSSILFHRTSTRALWNILDQNRFVLTGDMGTRAEQDVAKNDKKVFYLSTARSLSGSFGRRTYGNIACYIVLDGQKLMANGLSGNPIDYWGPAWRKEQPDNFESEDRIYYDKPVVKDAHKYILEVHALLPKKPDGSFVEREEYEKSDLRRTAIVCKKNKIDFYLYGDEKAFNARIKKKADPNLSRLKAHPEFKREPQVNWGKRDWLARYKELLHAPVDSKLSKDARRLLDDLKSYWYEDDQIRSLENDIHNAKKDVKTGEFIRLCQGLGLRTAKDVLKYIKKKWGIKDVD
jgi:hypothetical protein